MDKVKTQTILSIVQSLNKPRLIKSEPKLWSTLGNALNSHKNKPKKEMLFMGIPDGPGLTLFVSPAKSGKTICLENLGYALTGDRGTYLGEKICKNRRVLFISLEEFEDRRIERNAMQVASLESRGLDIGKIKDNYYVITGLFPRYIVSKDDIVKLNKVINQVRPDVIIIDSLSRMYRGAIETSEKAQSFIQPLKNFSDNNGIPIIVVHHTTKLGGKPLTLDSMAGSRLLPQEADAVIGVGKLKNGWRYIKPLAFRYADDTVDKMPVFKIDANAVTEYIGHKSEDQLFQFSDKRKGSNKKDAIYGYILTANSTSSSELESKFVASKTMGRSTLYANLDKLENEGLINRPGHGRYQAISEEE